MSVEGGGPGARLTPRQRRMLKWLGVAVAVPSAILFSLVAVFVARTEYMHDDSRCPFTAVEERVVGRDARVVEERRSCQEGVEEHRWTLERSDGRHRELGRRRLMSPQFARYDWSATEEEAGVVIQVRNEGVEDATFRETAPGTRGGP